MEKKVYYLILTIFLCLVFQDRVLAKEIKQKCDYEYYIDITDEGKTVIGTSYKGDVINFTLYDDGSYLVGGKPAGAEDILNWGKNTKYFDNIKSSKCMDYIVVMNTTYWGGLDYYGVNAKDLMEKATVAANGGMQFNAVYVFKNKSMQDSNLGVYSCKYQFYSIGVDLDNKTLSIRTNSGLDNMSYQLSEELKKSWFSEERKTDECLQTVSCVDKVSTIVTYKVFNDAMEASAAGYNNCETKPCSGSDCDQSKSSCTTYNTYLSEIDTLYSKIKNATGSTADLYKSVHDKEVKVTALCKGVMESYDYSENCVKACVNLESAIANIKNKYGINGADANAKCGLSARIANWIMKIINWLRYIVPVLLIILSILDFLKAIAADSEDEVKKVTSKFAKRLIVAVVIFLLPLALEFLLGIFGIDPSNFCL